MSRRPTLCLDFTLNFLLFIVLTFSDPEWPWTCIQGHKDSIWISTSCLLVLPVSCYVECRHARLSSGSCCLHFSYKLTVDWVLHGSKTPVNCELLYSSLIRPPDIVCQSEGVHEHCCDVYRTDLYSSRLCIRCLSNVYHRFGHTVYSILPLSNLRRPSPILELSLIHIWRCRRRG